MRWSHVFRIVGGRREVYDRALRDPLQVQLLEVLDLPECGDVDAHLLVVHANLFYCHDLSSLLMCGQDDLSERPRSLEIERTRGR